ncbi:hypothetical protein [Bradyrhizobium sp. CCBAU 53421]
MLGFSRQSLGFETLAVGLERFVGLGVLALRGFHFSEHLVGFSRRGG